MVTGDVCRKIYVIIFFFSLAGGLLLCPVSLATATRQQRGELRVLRVTKDGITTGIATVATEKSLHESR